MSGFNPTLPQFPSGTVAFEPVHFADSIQPCGVLLVLSDPDLRVQRASANTQDFLGISPAALLGQPIALLIEAETIAPLLQELSSHHRKFSRLAFRTRIRDRDFDGTLYRSEANLILELEPVPQPQSHGLQLHSRTRQTIAHLRQIPDLTEFLQAAVSEIRELTGFDRVMIYQFDAAGAGAVVAEAKRDDLLPYQGLHYPATDIPEPVRELYRCGLVRYIPDMNAPPVGLIAANELAAQHAIASSPTAPSPIDLKFSLLRSVDPCCVEYHRNMRVEALWVNALVQGEKLWGLISCHHQTPKPIAYEVRESCELLSQLIASELANKVNLEELSYLTRLRSLQSDFVQSISQAQDLKQALVNPAPRLLDLVSAQGAAVCLEDDITLIGNTPSLEQIRALLQWVDAQPAASPLFHSNALPKHYAEAAAFKDSASGLIVLQISKVRRYAILWFRPEVLQTVNWAGDPYAGFTVAEDGSVRLCPRHSFEQWQEVVRLTSLPWAACELENALDLRSAIVGIVLKKAEELARINQELENSTQELDSFAYAASHDLKEPLRGIHNYSKLLLKGYADVLDDAGKSKLETLVRLTRRMETLIDALLKFSRLGQTELRLQPTDLNQILHQVLEDLSVSRPHLQTTIRMPHPLPVVDCDAVLVQEVLMNLMSNAIKYNDKPDPWVEVGFLETQREPQHEPGESPASPLQSFTFYVRDNGIGIQTRHLNSVFRLFKRLHEQHLYGGGTGAGLTIAKKIIERHGGKIWVESTYGKGSTFFFTLD